MPYLSDSAVMIHYEQALYQVYAPLPFYLLPSPTCLTTSNLVVLPQKGVHINRKKPQNWGALRPRPLVVGAWLTPRNTLLPMTLVTLPNLVVLDQTVQALQGDPSEKFDLSRSAFQNHSRSSESTRFEI